MINQIRNPFLVGIIALSAAFNIAHAEGNKTKPTAVYGQGFSPITEAYAVDIETAKENAEMDATKKCGSSPVEVAENLGWQIQDVDFQPPCRPNHYCGGAPTKVSAMALFVCTANLSRQ